MPDKIIVDTSVLIALDKLKSACENVQKLSEAGFYVSEQLLNEIRKIEGKKDI